MNVFVDAPKHLSRAMFRVEKALKQYAPIDINFVETPAEADLQVLHVIGHDAYSYKTEAKTFAVIQYCFKTAEGDIWDWRHFWRNSRVVWTYYPDLPVRLGDHVYLAPLGIDPVFRLYSNGHTRRGLLTSGYVNGIGAEAIEEPTLAAAANNIPVFHLGPRPIGMNQLPPRWRSIHECTDQELAGYLNKVQWVSGLRYIEGFELPVIEGLACGARPIVFVRPETIYWYENHACFIEEGNPHEIREQLTDVFSREPLAVTEQEHECIRTRFDWQTIVEGFWKMVLAGG